MRSENSIMQINSYLFTQNNILSDLSNVVIDFFTNENTHPSGKTPLMFFLSKLTEEIRIGKNKYNGNDLAQRIGFLLEKSKYILDTLDKDGHSLLSYVVELRLMIATKLVESNCIGVHGDKNYPFTENLVIIHESLARLQNRVSSYKTPKDVEFLQNMLNKSRAEELKDIGIFELIDSISSENAKGVFSGEKDVLSHYTNIRPNMPHELKIQINNKLQKILKHENFEKLNLFWKKMKLDKNSWKNNMDKVYSDELSKLNFNSGMLDVSKFGVSIFTAALITVSVVLADLHLKGLLLGLAISSVVLLPVAILATSIFLYKFYQLVLQDRERIAKVQEISNKVNSTGLNENISYEQYESNLNAQEDDLKPSINNANIN